MATGIEERHARSCRTRKGGRCDCEPTYRASVWDGDRQERIRQSFSSHAEAVGWRKDARTALRRGRRPQVRSSVTLEEASAEWQRLAEANVIRTKKGEEFKPAALRAYERAMRLRVLSRYGQEALADLKRADWQQLVDELLADGVAPATIGTTIAAVACIYRHEVSRGRLKDNPLRGLDLPAVRNGRDHVVPPKAAGALLDDLPDDDRAAVGHRDVCRPQTRRAAGAESVRRGPGRGRDPRRTQL